MPRHRGPGVMEAAPSRGAGRAPPFVWTEELSVHDDLIDEQHQYFIDLANRVEHASHIGNDAETVLPLFMELIRYVHHHFEHEETVMLREGYPAYVEHKLEHEAVLREIGRLGDTVRDELELFSLVARFLPTWLFRHILHSDRTFGRYLADRKHERGC